MKLWQRKKKWIRETTNKLINTYLWHAFFQSTTKTMCYCAWNSNHRKDFILQHYDYYNGVLFWRDGTKSIVIKNKSTTNWLGIW